MTIEKAIEILKEIKKSISSDWSKEGNEKQVALFVAIEILEDKISTI